VKEKIKLIFENYINKGSVPTPPPKGGRAEAPEGPRGAAPALRV